MTCFALAVSVSAAVPVNAWLWLVAEQATMSNHQCLTFPTPQYLCENLKHVCSSPLWEFATMHKCERQFNKCNNITQQTLIVILILLLINLRGKIKHPKLCYRKNALSQITVNKNLSHIEHWPKEFFKLNVSTLEMASLHICKTIISKLHCL